MPPPYTHDLEGRHLLITFKVESEREDDGRWLAEVLELPGVLAYGETEQVAVSRVQALALRVVAERLEHGEVSPFFHEIAEVGDDIEIRGPIGGHFVWGPEDGGPVLLIGGGSGVVPLVSMLRHRAARGSEVPALLLFSARTWDDIIFRDELLALDGRRDGFELALTLTRESPRRTHDFDRRVDTEMLAEVLARLPGPPRHVFVCGTNAFVEAGAQSAIKAGVPAGIIRTERYGG